MTSLWWLALPVLLLPVWWHRQRRQRLRAEPLATARFLPRADPQQLRVWEWTDRILLLVRCLLLAANIALLADLALPWRDDSVIIGAGAQPAWTAQQIAAAGFKDARRVELTTPDAIGWLRQHEREWQADARLLVVGALPMPATLPRFRHQVEVRSAAQPFPRGERRVAIVSHRAAQWRALFAALDTQRYVVSEQPDDKAELIIWDVPEAPPPGLRAPLWWIGDVSAFPELRHGAAIDGMRYADSPRGRLWSAAPPADADAARALFERWQHLHYAPVAYPMPSQTLAASSTAPLAPGSGALRELLVAALAALFALERILTHASRR